jgi:hypothetical protein
MSHLPPFPGEGAQRERLPRPRRSVPQHELASVRRCEARHQPRELVPHAVGVVLRDRLPVRDADRAPRRLRAVRPIGPEGDGHLAPAARVRRGQHVAEQADGLRHPRLRLGRDPHGRVARLQRDLDDRLTDVDELGAIPGSRGREEPLTLEVDRPRPGRPAVHVRERQRPLDHRRREHGRGELGVLERVRRREGEQRASLRLVMRPRHSPSPPGPPRPGQRGRFRPAD